MIKSSIQLDKARHSLDRIDLSQQVKSQELYKKQKNELQILLLAIQQAIVLQKRRAILIFEGWDAAGKGGAIARLTESLDPRSYKVWPISAPSGTEKDMPFLHRFWPRLPSPGNIAIFDRSWYGRVLVERVEELASKAEWQRAYNEINQFERMLMDAGIPIIKLFLHISPEEQLRRFIERAENPVKRWKLSPDDFHNRRRWADYEAAINDMFEQTWTKDAPWHLIPSNYKWFGRIQSLKIVTQHLKKEVDLAPPKLSLEIKHLLKTAQDYGESNP